MPDSLHSATATTWARIEAELLGVEPDAARALPYAARRARPCSRATRGDIATGSDIADGAAVADALLSARVPENAGNTEAAAL